MGGNRTQRGMGRELTVLLMVLATGVLPVVAAAEEQDTARAIQELRKEVEELRQTVRALQDALKAQQPQGTPPVPEAQQQKELEAEIRAAMPPATPATPAAEAAAVAQPGPGPAGAKSSSILNPDISFIGDFTFLGTDNRQLDKANRFSFREAEVGFQAPIDPFARADAFITVDESGSVDIEEATATFVTLPYNLQARVGKFRLLFGKNNTLHRHALPQTDRPFAEAVVFGPEGFSGTGVEVSYLVPNPWDQYVLLTTEVVNDLTAASSGSEQGSVDEPPPAAREFRDFAFLGHLQYFVDLNADNNLELGGSALLNLPKSGTQTRLYGVDLTYRWRPLGQAGYRQFLWRTEGYFLNQDVREAVPPATDGIFDTDGFYTYGEYRAGQRVWLGTRVDWTEIPAQRRDTEWGVSPYVTFAPTEFGYFRLEYQYTVSDQLQQKTANRVWLQYDFSIGPHAAHAF